MGYVISGWQLKSTAKITCSLVKFLETFSISFLVTYPSWFLSKTLKANSALASGSSLSLGRDGPGKKCKQIFSIFSWPANRTPNSWKYYWIYTYLESCPHHQQILLYLFSHHGLCLKYKRIIIVITKLENEIFFSWPVKRTPNSWLTT